MNDRLQQVVTRTKSVFTGFTPGQRAVTVIAVVVALVGGVVFYQWASKPTLAPLSTAPYSQADAGAITAKLTEQGVPFELDGTTISVPRDQVDKVRIDLAAENLPAETEESGGYSLVADAPMTASDAQQRILVKRATEGELKKAIEKVDTVQEATVQLALPEPDVFTREQTKPTASVLVSPKPNQEVSASQVEAVVHLVSSAIPKLEANSVTVTDSSGKLLSSPGNAGAGSGEKRVAQQAAISAQISQNVQAMLDKAVGPGNSTVAVQAELDYDAKQIERNEYLAPVAGSPPVQSDKTSETMTGTGQTPVGGVLGPDNIPVPQANAAGGNSNYEKTTDKSINALGTQRTTTVPAAGQVKRINIAAMIDSRNAAAVNQAAIQAMICTAAGVDPKRGDVCQVQKVPFDTRAAEAQKADAAALEAQKKQDDLIALAKNIGLALLLLLALLIGFRKSRKKTKTVDFSELDAMPVLPLPSGAAAIEGPPPSAYELDDGDDMRVLEATPVDPQAQARIEARQEITSLVEENPDEVARLLRGWMAERK